MFLLESELLSFEEISSSGDRAFVCFLKTAKHFSIPSPFLVSLAKELAIASDVFITEALLNATIIVIKIKNVTCFPFPVNWKFGEDGRLAKVLCTRLIKRGGYGEARG